MKRFSVLSAALAMLVLTSFAYAADPSITCPGGSAITVSCGLGTTPPPTPGTCPDGVSMAQESPCKTVKCSDGNWYATGFTCPTTPPPGPVATNCPGFDKTVVMTFVWDKPGRLASRDYGHMGINDAAIFVFTTGPYPNPTNNLASISAVEFDAIQSTRIAVLSDKPCDWSAQPVATASASGITVTVPFAVANYASTYLGFYSNLEVNKTYYFNIKNDPTGGCAKVDGVGACDLAAQLSHSNWAPSAVAATNDPADAKMQAAFKAYAKAATGLQAAALPADVAAARATRAKAKTAPKK